MANYIEYSEPTDIWEYFFYFPEPIFLRRTTMETVDYTEHKVVVVPLDPTTQSITEVYSKTNNNFEALKNKHNASVDDFQLAVNTLSQEIETFTGMGDEARTNLAETVTQLQGLTGTVAENILDGQDIIADRVNKIHMNTPISVTYNVVEGISLDLSAYGFANVGDYTMSLHIENSDGKLVELKTAKTSESAYTVKAIDKNYFDIAQKAWDPTTKGNLDIQGTLNYKLSDISLNISDMEGDVHEIGGEQG